MGTAVELAMIRRMAADGGARRLRQAAGLRLGDVAEDLGVTPATVSRWETAQRSPRGPVALRYAHLVSQLIDVLTLDDPAP